MVSANPLFRGQWTPKKWQAMVINDIWPEVSFFTLIAAMVTLISELTDHKPHISPSLLNVLGVILALVISFRTSSAYETYQEGRKLWSNITVACRNLAVLFWVHIPDDPNDIPDPLRGAIQKKTMINLIQAFAVSVKHLLRNEPGIYHKDLFPLLCHLPQYANATPKESEMLPLWAACHDPTYPNPHHPPNYKRHSTDATLTNRITKSELEAQPTETEKLHASHHVSPSASEQSRRKSIQHERSLPQVYCARTLEPARNPPEETIYDYVPILRCFRWLFRLALRRPVNKEAERLKKKKFTVTVESNVPLEIVLVLSSYVSYLVRSRSGDLKLPDPIVGEMTGTITTLQDTWASLERIRNTPLPFAYQAHLRMTLWLYLSFLPFQIYPEFKWVTIPATAFASFLLLGFLEIGQEIENPFNYDLNDLDLDDFCLSLQRQLHEITAFINPDPASYAFTAWNQPFAPTDRRTAADMIKEYIPHDDKPTTDSETIAAKIRTTLVTNWREVNTVTRK